MIIPDAQGNIVTRLESQKIVEIENLRVCTTVPEGLVENTPKQFTPDLISLILGLRAPNFAHR
jgi:hypothetical protein